MVYLSMPLKYMNTFEVELKVNCSYLPLGVTLHVHLCSSVLCILCTHSIYFMHVCIALYLSYVCVCVCIQLFIKLPTGHHPLDHLKPSHILYIVTSEVSSSFTPPVLFLFSSQLSGNGITIHPTT